MTTTPNIGIFIPSDGESLYGESFAEGMNNIDAHDHSGALNKGLPIASSGIADGSVTKEKLNPDVVSAGEGLAIDLTNPNALKADGVLNALYKLITTGILVRTGSGTVATRSLTPGSSKFSVTNGDGVAGNIVGDVVPGNILLTSLNGYSANTFVPGIAFGGASVGVTYAALGQLGYYIRVGNLVMVNIKLILTSKGSSTGAATITGLPFTSANQNFSGNFNVGISNITLDAGYQYAGVIVFPNDTVANFNEYGTGLVKLLMVETTFANNSEVEVSGFYFTS